MKSKGCLHVFTIAIALLLLGSSVFFIRPRITHAASYCQVSYTITNQWSGGFGANITIQNTSSTLWTNWSLVFSFPAAGQTIKQGWNGIFTQSGQTVTVTNATWNGSVSVNGSTTPGFNASWSGSNPVPTNFSVNGNICSGSPVITPTPGVTPTPVITPTPGVTPTPIPGSHTGNATWFSGIGGTSYGGCGVPQANLDSQNFVAFNVQNTPKDYTTMLSRPISAQYASEIGMFNNGLNCGRWVQVTISNYCTGINDGAQNQPFCRNGNWVMDKYNGATLDMIVADSCQDGNAWCRDDPNHLDLSHNSLNLFSQNGQPVGDMDPNHWNNRQINWQFIQAPNYTGDIQIGFLQGANSYWSAISITHLANGIHGIDYYQNGAWIKAKMDSDMGNDYVVLPTLTAATMYQIRVHDASDQLINNGRIYNFAYPASCGSSCPTPYVAIPYTVS